MNNPFGVAPPPRPNAALIADYTARVRKARDAYDPEPGEPIERYCACGQTLGPRRKLCDICRDVSQRAGWALQAQRKRDRAKGIAA